MEQAAATGELRRGLVSRWRRRDSPVRVRKRRGGGGGERKQRGTREEKRGGRGKERGKGTGSAEGEEKKGGMGRENWKDSIDLYTLFTAPHCQSLTILYKPHQSRLSKHLIEWRAHISMAAVFVTP